MFPNLTSADLDSLKTIIAFSQSLSQWSALLIGGTVVALLATSNWRPRKFWVRCAYLLFIPALIMLFISAYYGVSAQENCLAFMLLAKVSVDNAKLALNDNLHSQLVCMQWGFSTLGLWFFCVLFWWVFDKTIDSEKKG